MRPNPQETVDFVTFTEKILNEKVHFLWSGNTETHLHPKNELGYKVVLVTRPTSPWGEIRFRVKLPLSIKKLLRVVTRSTWPFQQGLVMNNPENTFTLSPFSLFK